MVVSNNLGTLGSVTGDPVEIYWNPLFRLSGFVPWILAGLLLMLRKNRANRSWLCFVAFAVTTVLASSALLITNIVPGEKMFDILSGVALGLCAAWLLAPYLARRSHVANFILLLCILLLVSLVSILFSHGLDGINNSAIPMVAYLIICSYISFNVSLAFNLASRLTKTNYSSTRFLVRLLVLTPIIWLATTIIFPLIEGSWSGFLIAMLISSLIVFLVQLPLLLFSFKNQNLRLRMEAWQCRLPAEPPTGVQDATECRSSIEPLQ